MGFKFPVKYTATHVSYTRYESKVRSFYPPKDYIHGKVRELKAWFGRMNGDEKCFYINLYPRLTSSKYGEECGVTVLSEKELGNIVPINGDCLWIWEWEEEQIGKGIVPRLHIEVESLVLAENDRFGLLKLLQDNE